MDKGLAPEHRVLTPMNPQNPQKEANEKISRVEFESQKLLDAASIVLQSEDFAQAAKAVFNIAKELTGAASGYVALLSDDGQENEVLFLDSGGLPCSVDENLPMPIRGLREVAYRENRPAYDNSFMISDWVKYMPQGHVILNNVMFGPLVISGKAEGLIGLANKPSAFNEDDARIVMALSNLVAIGLRKAKIEAELRENQKKLSETLSELQLYSSLLRHDLSNDLQLIIGEVQLAQDEASKEHRGGEYLTSIESASSRMLRLLQAFNRNDLLDEDDLVEIINHLVADTRLTYPEIIIHFDAPPDSEKIAIRGMSLLPFVFDNLIRNAVQHVSSSVEIDIHLNIDPDKTLLDFVDDGPGIDASIVPHLFQKGVSNTGGGYGLYLSRKIIESYQGSISLLEKSFYNRGTAFRIELPRIKIELKKRAH
jgi:signal transduction histidine kinase